MRWLFVLFAVVSLILPAAQPARADLVGQGKVPFMVEPATGRAFYVRRATKIRVPRKHLRYHTMKIRVTR